MRAREGAFTSVAHNALRVMAGVLFWQHGAQKLFGWLGGTPVQELASLRGLAGILEFFGGILIVLGLLTVPVAAVLVIEMAVAYFRAHAPQALWPIENGGEPALLFLFIFLFLATAGPGRLSVDAWLKRRRAEAPEGGRPSARPENEAGPVGTEPTG